MGRRWWLVLALISISALGVLVCVWWLANPSKDTLWYEVAKTSLQVLGVAVIGGLVTVATSTLQHNRQLQLDKDRKKDLADAESLERQREQFKIRATLLDRTASCAQRMFVTGQHVRRMQSDSARAEGSSPMAPDTLALLDDAYLQFSAEAAALQIELGARFGIRMSDEEDPGSGWAYLRWHQISDLLTVYYFNLRGNFRRDVLKRNSKTAAELHAGLDFQSMVTDPQRPTPQELSAMRRSIRKEFAVALPRLAQAIADDELRDL